MALQVSRIKLLWALSSNVGINLMTCLWHYRYLCTRYILLAAAIDNGKLFKWFLDLYTISIFYDNCRISRSLIVFHASVLLLTYLVDLQLL